MNPAGPRWSQPALPMLAIVLWGGNAVVAKASAAVIPPAEMNGLRWLIAALLLIPFAASAMVRHRRELLRALPRLVVLGLLGSAAFPYLMYVAAQSTTATNIGMIQALMPFMAIGLSAAFLGGAISKGVIAGSAIALVGVAIVLARGDPGELFAHPPNRGDLVMVAATACFALYSVLLARWRGAIPPTVSMFVQACTAVVVMAPVAMLEPGRAIAPTALPLVVYAGVLGSVAAPLLWMRGVALIGASRASVMFNLLPFVTAALAVALLGEPLGISLVAGGVLVLAGVALAERAAKRMPAPPAQG